MSNFSTEVLHFSPHPGAHERCLKRAAGNSLFDELNVEVSPRSLEDAQLQDKLEVDHFMEEFHNLVERVVSLDSKVESDVILEIKQELDKSYEICSGLGGEMDEVREAIKQLLELVMKAIHKGAGDDQQALMNLAEEQLARELHFELLEYPLVADLLRPDSLVSADALVPSILSEELDAVPAVMSLFTPEQATELHATGEALLTRLEQAGLETDDARTKLNIMARAAAVKN